MPHPILAVHIAARRCRTDAAPAANAREATFSSHRPCSDLDLAHPAVPILLLAELDGHERFA
jgi:hypothetical protein